MSRSRRPAITWATTTGAPTVISFSPVNTPRLRLDLTSAGPDTANGAQRVSEFTTGPN
jgi:beta-galactosidase